jgi:hypothetical protein
MGKWTLDPGFPDLVTKWRLVVSFTLLPLYPRVKNHWYSLDRLGGPLSRSGRYGEVNFLELTGTGTHYVRVESGKVNILEPTGTGTHYVQSGKVSTLRRIRDW